MAAPGNSDACISAKSNTAPSARGGALHASASAPSFAKNCSRNSSPKSPPALLSDASEINSCHSRQTAVAATSASANTASASSGVELGRGNAIFVGSAKWVWSTAAASLASNASRFTCASSVLRDSCRRRRHSFNVLLAPFVGLILLSVCTLHRASIASVSSCLCASVSIPRFASSDSRTVASASQSSSNFAFSISRACFSAAAFSSATRRFLARMPSTHKLCISDGFDRPHRFFACTRTSSSSLSSDIATPISARLSTPPGGFRTVTMLFLPCLNPASMKNSLISGSASAPPSSAKLSRHVSPQSTLTFSFPLSRERIASDGAHSCGGASPSGSGLETDSACESSSTPSSSSHSTCPPSW
mmetsp:Transcript_9383/g.24932  ORF Transcript_9383/g.24932 Transcript_9383/m.24932 type:complete len:361 (-) Transcript_9383:94-1176(-)